MTLALVVVGLGLRRKLSDVTRSGLPQYERDPEATSIATELYTGPRRRNQLSPQMRKANIGLYLFMSLGWTALAVLEGRDRLIHVLTAVTAAVGVVVFVLRRPSPDPRGHRVAAKIEDPL